MLNLIILIVISTSLPCLTHAVDCPDNSPIGFGASGLRQLGQQLKKVPSIKEQCQIHKAAFSHLQNQNSEIMNKSIAAAKLIILGEEHQTPAQRDYDKIFDQLKMNNEQIDCLFLEWNPNDEDAKKLIRGESVSFTYLQHSEIVKAAIDSKVKIFAVDGRDKNKIFDSKDALNYIRESNESIFKNTKKLFDSGSCSAGIMLIGKAHVEHPQFQIELRDSIKSFFIRDGISTVAINLVYSGKNVYADNFSQEWAWNICSTDDSIVPLKKQVLVEKSKLNETEGMVVFPVRTFDYYLFLPEVDQKHLFPPE